MRLRYIGLLLFAIITGLVKSDDVIYSSTQDHTFGTVLVSTIDGQLRALDTFTGRPKWTLKEAPVLRAPSAIKQGFTFLPNPQDGSLYALKEGSLKKMPFNIPQLVHLSPSKDNEGILYAGNKKDLWFGLDPETGNKIETLSSMTAERICPANKARATFIGRSEYHLSMFDTKDRTRTWNATFTDYSAHLLPADAAYPYQHFASSSTGHVLTVDVDGQIVWEKDLGQPIVAMYLLQNDGLHKLRYTVIGRESMERLINDKDRVMPTGRRLVNVDYPAITTITEEGEFLLLGYHEPPTTDLSLGLFQTRFPSMPHIPSIDYVPPKQPKHLEDNNHKTTNSGFHMSAGDETLASMIYHIYERYPSPFYASVISIIVLIITTVWLCGRQSGVALIQQNEARSAQTSRHSNGGRGWMYTKIDEVPEGWFAVGKVQYNPLQVLGRGCEGTVVYKGKFDGREVAVKRVVSEFMRLVEREVDHLRESDTHPHVIRYFCMESDSQFRYLALELCIASLYDYVEQKTVRQKIDVPATELLRQASDGLAHLHSIHIVHRDMKPQNVLLSMANSRGQVRALISDFGLCKRVRPGRNSLSQRSGMAGTDGWIAPEAIFDQSTSYPVDVFSLGCIFYYVLSGGLHPFGDPFQRQMNIMNGKSNLRQLENDKNNQESLALISQMIQIEPLSRPSAQTVLLHPMFWSPEKKLQFFGDVSDRVEKEEDQAPVVQRLESNAKVVVNFNWRQHICDALAEDLRKFRTYKGHSVRDLLRAMRNKKHHYRELPVEVRESLGHIPEQFVHYFTSRYPHLLLHSYESLKWCAQEPVFRGYYSDQTRELIQPDVERVEEERKQAKIERETAEPTKQNAKKFWSRGHVIAAKKTIETTIVIESSAAPTLETNSDFAPPLLLGPPPGFEDVSPIDIKNSINEDELRPIVETEDPLTFEKPKKKKNKKK